MDDLVGDHCVAFLIFLTLKPFSCYAVLARAIINPLIVLYDRIRAQRRCEIEKGISTLMRPRNARPEDIDAILHLQEVAAQNDGVAEPTTAKLQSLFSQAFEIGKGSAFIVTDDDDELNEWSQAGTLDGVSGETVGYTILQSIENGRGYHLLAWGTVHPEQRRKHAGRFLLMAALNHARFLVDEFEAEHEGVAVYFEALFPVNDAGAASLAAKCEMQSTDEPAPTGLRLYRRVL